MAQGDRYDLEMVIWRYRAATEALSPLLKVRTHLTRLYRWTDPHHTICFLFVTSVCLVYPEYLQCLCIGAISLVLGMGYLSRAQPTPTGEHLSVNPNDFVNPRFYSLQPADSPSAAVTNPSFRYMLQDVHSRSKAVLQLVSDLDDVITWKDYEFTKKMLIVLLAVAILPVAVHLNWIMFAGLIVTFCYNRHFVNFVASTILNQATIVIAPGPVLAEGSDGLSGRTTSGDSDTFSESETESDVAELYLRLGHQFCVQCSVPISGKAVECKLCGDFFCPSCCSTIVTRELLGVTNPLTKNQSLRVCTGCWVIHGAMVGEERTLQINRAGSLSKFERSSQVRSNDDFFSYIQH